MASLPDKITTLSRRTVSRDLLSRQRSCGETMVGRDRRARHHNHFRFRFQQL
jgi:hypothetical protein